MPSPETTPSDLLTRTYSGLDPLAAKLAELDARLVDACASPNPSIVAKAQQLRRKIRDFEPSVTMIGQVKAGKTTLVNAMTGWNDMLPADVNPWTSVVTSLHMQPGPRRSTAHASFRFFTEEEWSHLVTRGGRMGELAGRAGADDELDKVRAQLEAMREKSRDRLGRRFEMLLGQSHDYENFDAALIERYVCMGDDFWEEAGGDRDKGRFADITRTADLWLRQPELPVRLCLRDTPGVNDTFMIREQITINALRGSRLCVMVLAASQALTSVDLALVRMISNVKSRDVIIFVNRIDELSDPGREVPEIRESIRETLRKHDGPTDAEIIFGCGYWASEAMAGGVDSLGRDSAEALLSWARATFGTQSPFDTVEEMVWNLSGMEALGSAIATRIEAGAGSQILQEIAVEIGNLDQSVTASDAMASAIATGGKTLCRLSEADLTDALDSIEQAARSRFLHGLAPLRHGLMERIETSRQTFVNRATAALLKHLEAYGELEVWSYDPCGLRVLLRSSFQRYVRSASRHGSDCLNRAAADLNALYEQAFALDSARPTLEPPPVPTPEPPVVLGQTIALDLRSTWWSRFWRRRKGYQSCADDFAHLIRQETQPILDTLVTDHAQGFEASLHHALSEFLATNRSILLDIARTHGVHADPSGVQAEATQPNVPGADPAPSAPVRPVRPVRPSPATSSRAVSGPQDSLEVTT
ncbi:dynamin family protein [Cognatishimia sp. F0-27]|uniref:dynamin family protein n=1 Tax=Cognatishimia sp. F0-27 TaxID=2816855 RepID=UPI001D0CA800|nr:dynamin family protein [Cognatishimia sp. F0-27]MCC1493801.1 dynamin family protein [Cognatishimia sp. F0-27]